MRLAVDGVFDIVLSEVVRIIGLKQPAYVRTWPSNWVVFVFAVGQWGGKDTKYDNMEDECPESVFSPAEPSAGWQSKQSCVCRIICQRQRHLLCVRPWINRLNTRSWPLTKTSSTRTIHILSRIKPNKTSPQDPWSSQSLDYTSPQAAAADSIHLSQGPSSNCGAKTLLQDQACKYQTSTLDQNRGLLAPTAPGTTPVWMWCVWVTSSGYCWTRRLRQSGIMGGKRKRESSGINDSSDVCSCINNGAGRRLGKERPGNMSLRDKTGPNEQRVSSRTTRVSGASRLVQRPQRLIVLGCNTCSGSRGHTFVHAISADQLQIKDNPLSQNLYSTFIIINLYISDPQSNNSLLAPLE